MARIGSIPSSAIEGNNAFRMPALVVLHALKPSEPVSQEVLDGLRAYLGWENRLFPGPGNRVEIPFLSIDQGEALEHVEHGLNRVARDLSIAWDDYFDIALPSDG